MGCVYAPLWTDRYVYTGFYLLPLHLAEISELICSRSSCGGAVERDQRVQEAAEGEAQEGIRDSGSNVGAILI